MLPTCHMCSLIHLKSYAIPLQDWQRLENNVHISTQKYVHMINYNIWISLAFIQRNEVHVEATFQHIFLCILHVLPTRVISRNNTAVFCMMAYNTVTTDTSTTRDLGHKLGLPFSFWYDISPCWKTALWKWNVGHDWPDCVSMSCKTATRCNYYRQYINVSANLEWNICISWKNWKCWVASIEV